MKLIRKYQRFVKFCLVGGSGAVITFGITWVLTELVGLWYMASMIIAVAIATVWNYNFNTFWTYRTSTKFTDANYEWEAFYNGNPIQKWWKQSIANTVWEWMPPENSGLLLDWGCGASPIISKYKNAMGVDNNVAKLEFMRLQLPHLKFLSSLYGLMYDNIICIEVLEHQIEPLNMIKQASEMLVNGGKVIFATPDYSKPLWSVAEKFTPYKDDHRYKLNRESLETLCKSVNLYPVKYRYVASCDLIEMFEKR